MRSINKPMKVFVIIDHWFPNIGGGITHIAEIVSELIRIKKEIQISIVTSKLIVGNSKLLYNPYPRLPVIKLGESGSFWSLKSRLQFSLSLFSFLMKEEFDILHVHPYTPVLIAKLVCLIKRKPIVMTIHVLPKDVFVGNKILSKVFILFDRMLTFRVKYHAQIFVDKNLQSIPNVNINKHYIPNGINLRLFRKIKRTNYNKNTILYIGRLHQQKNILSLVNAIYLISRKYPKIKLLIVGEGSLKSAIQTQIKLLKIEKNVEVIKSQHGKNVIKLYKEASMLILPSFYEGFPLSLLEAWGAKLPVLATSVGMVKSLLINNQNGIIIKGFSATDIACAIEQALLHKNLQKLGLNGYRSVVKKYTSDIIASKTLHLYKTLYEKN